MRVRQRVWRIPAMTAVAMCLSAAQVRAEENVLRLEGIGAQAGATWSMRVDIEDGRYRISYPSLCCGGVWEPLGQEGDVYRFRERLEYGRDQCIDNGWVTLIDEADYFIFSYTAPPEKEPMASGVLHPAGSPAAKAALQQTPSPVIACKNQPIS